MGAACCCFRVPDPVESSNSSDNGSCTYLSGLIHTVINKYASLFGGDRVHALPLTNQGPVLLTANVPSHNPDSETTISVPRTFPFDDSPRQSNSQMDNIVARQECGVDPLHLHKYSQVRSSDHMINEEGKEAEGETKNHCFDSSLKLSFNKVEPAYVHESSEDEDSEDEDVCPTCLEEYTPENPRIVTKCCHHYHLSCIYEWMERSTTCPVCSKEMIFEETS